MISFFLNCYWLPWNSTFISFRWYTFCCCFYSGRNKVFLFVIGCVFQASPKQYKLVSFNYRILIAYIANWNWLTVISRMDNCFNIYMENSDKAILGSVGLLLSCRTIKSLNSSESIRSRMMCVSYYGKLLSLATVPPMLAMKRASSRSVTSYLLFFDTFLTQRSNHRWRLERWYWKRQK